MLFGPENARGTLFSTTMLIGYIFFHQLCYELCEHNAEEPVSGRGNDSRGFGGLCSALEACCILTGNGGMFSQVV